MSEQKTAGQIAFEAYNLSKGGVTYDGKPIPPWSEVGVEVRCAWEAAADAARHIDSPSQETLHELATKAQRRLLERAREVHLAGDDLRGLAVLIDAVERVRRPQA